MKRKTSKSPKEQTPKKPKTPRARFDMRNKILTALDSTSTNDSERLFSTPIIIDEKDKQDVKQEETPYVDIKNQDGLSYLTSVEDDSIDLILTDPPYIISKSTGMDKFHKKVAKLDESGVSSKTEEEWKEYVEKNPNIDFANKENYLKYGSIYGKKYSVQTDYGKWDNEFTMESLQKFISIYYKKLRKGGTLIIFFDLWKISHLYDLLVNAKFAQIRFIEWLKPNPQPRNSKVNYLTNSREIALSAVKGGCRPTFNSKYDNGLYIYPFPSQRNRHPTQKSLGLFEELVQKHSNPGDTVMDTFLGSGTTARACINTGRKFRGCEASKEYYDTYLKSLVVKTK